MRYPSSPELSLLNLLLAYSIMPYPISSYLSPLISLPFLTTILSLTSQTFPSFHSLLHHLLLDSLHITSPFYFPTTPSRPALLPTLALVTPFQISFSSYFYSSSHNFSLSSQFTSRERSTRTDGHSTETISLNWNSFCSFYNWAANFFQWRLEPLNVKVLISLNSKR